MAGMLASAVVKQAGVKLGLAMVKLAGVKLGSAIGDKIMMQWNFKKDLEYMRTTLETMEAALDDAEKQSIKNKEVALWLKRLKNAAYDISDMLDEFEANSKQYSGKTRGMLSCLPCGQKNITANKMKTMREELRKIEEQHNRFKFTPNTTPSIDQQHYDERETTSDVNQSDIIGREGEKQAIIDLLSARSNKDETMILPIHGLGGIGKTTLAGQVFNDNKFKEYDHRVWVYVSQVFDLKKIGSSIISQLPKQGSQQSTETMELINRCLDDLLRDKKILIVLDDIWEEDNFKLKRLTDMLHVGKKGSMIDVIATTRKEDIAEKICTDKPYKLEPLKEDTCWDIIKKYSHFESKPNKEQFEQIGREIAKKCGGVPLAAQALGYTLKPIDLRGWSAVNNSDIWNESSEDENFPHNTVLPSLKLSFKSMPPHFRLCFAYCAIFPKGHNIVEDDLIHQWIALDLIEPSRRVGEKYIKQLLGMSFLRHSKLSTTTRKYVLCYTMHDLVHDLARSVMDDELVVFNAATKSNTSEHKYCRYALVTNYDGSSRLSTILPTRARALHFLHSSKPELSSDAFSFAKYLRVLDFSQCSTTELPASVGQLKLLRCLIAPRMQEDRHPECITKLSKLQYLNLHGSSQISALPKSFDKLGCLIHLDLSGCSNIVDLPESFGNLENLLRLDLSGCSAIPKLPESFGKLKSSLHLGLSSCSAIEKLPESFGNLQNLLHLDLSGCSAIEVLPESFGDLKNLLHLDLSCTRVKGVPGALSGLNKLQHLNISRSRCYDLTGLSDVLGNLTELQYLNLSESLDPILRNLPRSEREGYVQCISALTNLEHLDLSRNGDLDYLPESLGNLKRLHTLDVSGCRSLETIPRSIRAIHTLKFLLVANCSPSLTEHMRHYRLKNSLSLPIFTVHANDANTCSNLHQLGDINPNELEICCLENTMSMEEARCVQLLKKQNLSKLTFDWTLGPDRLYLDDKDLLGELVPPKDLKELGLRGYNGVCFPTWLMLGISRHLPNLVKINLKNLPRCNHLPPLGQLPNLEELRLERLHSVTKLDGDLCGGRGAFRRLSTFRLEDMERLEEWSTTYSGEDGVEFMFPKLETLQILDCRSLRLKPCPPIFSTWFIRSSDKVISSWGEEGHLSVPSSTPATTLTVRSSKVPKDEWRLLHHIPTLQKLELFSCDYLASLPESMRHLTSLRSLSLGGCKSISLLPEWMGDLTVLKSLTLYGCPSMKSLPQGVQQLTKLNILQNPELRKWCESEDNRMKLCHIEDISYSGCDSEGDSSSKNDSVSLQLFMSSDVNTCSNLHQLEDVNLSELQISCLEGVRFLEEARKIKLLDRQSLSKLTLEWTSDDDRILEDEAVLEELVPPGGLKHLKLDGYSSISFPTWLMGISRHLPNLVEIKLENLPRCNKLPPLGQLPNLEELHLERLHSVTKIDEDLCGGGGAFRRLSSFRLEDMEQLEEWSTTYSGEDGVKEFMFPKLETLAILDCRSLRLKPCPPIFSTWFIRSSDKVISSWGEGGHISVPSSTPATSLTVRSSKVPKDKWRLLHHIPTLQVLELYGCDYLASLPESMRHHTSLRSLNLGGCNSISVLPEWMGDLTSLKSLKIFGCWSLKSLPQGVQQLTELTIVRNHELRKWCESEDNRMKLCDIEDISYSGCDSVEDSSFKNDSVPFQLFMSSNVNTCSNLHQLEDVNLSELQISCLEDVRFLKEARKIKLLDRQSLSKLTLEWTSDDDRILEDEAVLGELVPPGGLKHLKLDGYSSISFPTWLMGISRHLPNLVEIKLENLPRCKNLPPLGQLPKLKELHLRRLHGIAKIDGDLCGGRGAFRRLSFFWLEDMEQLEEWSTTYSGEDGVKEFMFPKLERLEILDCRSLRLKPCPPIFSTWFIRSSDKVISSWGEEGHLSVPSSTPATTLMVRSSKVPKDEWRLLHHIPTLQELILFGCDYLANLPESMRRLTSLRSLSLGGCKSISVLPEWMGDLSSLEILNIRGCRGIKSLPQGVQQLTKLAIFQNPELRKWCESEDNRMKLVNIEDTSYSGCDSVVDSSSKNDAVSLQLVMSSDVNTCSNLHQLEDVNLSELQISCLEGVRFLEEARKIKLLDRQSISKLTLEWTSDDDRILEDEAVLGELVPPGGLKHLKLDGYSSISFPTWLMGISRHLPNLVEIKLENLPRCNNLPPLGQLPKLKELHLRRLHNITKIDGDLCGGRGAFRRLSFFWLEDMEQLEEWSTTYSGEDGVREFMFPKLETLTILDCRSLRLKPCPPIFSTWFIRSSDKVISSWGEEGHFNVPSSTPATTLEVYISKVPKDKWRLLHHVPTLQELKLRGCDHLASLPESMRHLTSLRSLCLGGCKSISALPEWMGDLTSLESLKIFGCRSIKSLPQGVQQLAELTITQNPELRKWCESDYQRTTG